MKAIGAVIVVIAVTCAVAPHALSRAQQADTAMSYLKAKKNSDGGFSEPGAGSETALTCWALIAYAAAGDRTPSQEGGGGTLDFLRARAGETNDLPEVELAALALLESGVEPVDARGRDLLSIVSSSAGEDGKIGEDIDTHCMALIALSAAEKQLPTGSVDWLASQQREDGAWGEEDADDVAATALAVEALVAAGYRDTTKPDKALVYLKGKMRPDGGFAGASGNSDSITTASVVRAIYAGGQDPDSEAWGIHGINPMIFLQMMQADDGHFFYSKGVESQPAMSTAVAVPAVLGKHIPLAVPELKRDEETKGGRVRDLGTAGAAMSPEKDIDDSSPAASTAPGDTSPLAAGAPRVSAYARRTSWVSGFWLLVIAFAAYLAFMILVVLIVARMVKEREPVYRPGGDDKDLRRPPPKREPY